MVRVAGRLGAPTSWRTRRSWGAQPADACFFMDTAARPSSPRRRRARGDRRRGAIRGHGPFRHAPIRLAWFVVVLPALMLNYFGQGALLLERPEAASNPFYLLAPAGRCTADRAGHRRDRDRLAGGDLGRLLDHAQAIQLGYLPRMRISTPRPRDRADLHPGVNWMLMPWWSRWCSASARRAWPAPTASR